MKQRVTILWIALTAIVASACDSTTESSPDAGIPNVEQWVTGEAAGALDRAGHFGLSVPDRPAGQIISSTMARDLADVFFQTFAFPDVALGSTFGEELIHEHGPFDPRRVTVSPITYFAETPYAPLPDTLPSYVRKYLGARFITYFRLGSKTIGTLAGSALNTDLRIENGHIRGPIAQGGEWLTTVVPRGRSYAHPITPERAVEVVGLLTGAKTNRIPRLLLPHRRYSAALARWEIHLERPITVTGDSTGTTYTTNLFYVGTAGPSQISGLPGNLEQVWVPLRMQQVEDVVPYRGTSSDKMQDLIVRAVYPVLFERALFSQ
jgi:hypothetical protein